MATAPEAEAERKRVRGRAYVKRFYEKKKTTLAALQAELAALDVQYTTLAAHAHAQLGQPSPLQQRYEELTRLKRQLYAENDALRAHAAEHMIREARLQQLLDAHCPPPLSEALFQFRPFTSDKCEREILACRTYVARFLAEAGASRRPRGLEVFGWSDQRDVADGQLAFAFEKTFRDTSPRELLERTWTVFKNEASHSAIFSASLNARVHILQHVDDNAMLVYWRFEPDDAPLTIKCLFLILRFEIADGGFVIACRYVDKDAIALDDSLLDESLARDRPVYWAKMDTWTLLQRSTKRASDSTYLFRGTTMARVWTVEVLLVCMRFESLALGSRMLPPST